MHEGNPVLNIQIGGNGASTYILIFRGGGGGVRTSCPPSGSHEVRKKDTVQLLGSS